MGGEKGIQKKLADPICEEKEEIRKVLSKKRKRLIDNKKEENAKLIEILKDDKKKLEDEKVLQIAKIIEEQARQISKIKEEKALQIAKIEQKIEDIQKGEQNQLNFINEEIDKEEYLLILALEEEIKIQKIFESIKEKGKEGK